MLSTWFKHSKFSSIAAGQSILQAGDTGEAVVQLQGALIALGYSMAKSIKSSGKLDGVFGDEVYDRVCEFQKKAFPSQNPDGKVGKKTLGEMDSRLASNQSSGGDVVFGEDAPVAPPVIPGSPREVDMGMYFGNKRAIRQVHDMACWAACLEFWLKCVGGRTTYTQAELIAMYAFAASNEPPPKCGGMGLKGFEKIFDSSYQSPNRPGQTFNHRAAYRPNFSNWNADWLRNNCSFMSDAIIIGYKIGASAHVNVVGYYELNETPFVWAMEPWVGRFKIREVSYYAQSTSTFIVHKSLLG